MNPLDIFGFNITKKKSNQKQVASPVSPPQDDGATLVSAANYYGISVDLDGSLKNENELIRKYRETCNYPDCDSAVEDIVNEAIVSDGINPIVEINLEDLKISESIKTKVTDEFNTVLKLLKFSDKGHDMFRSWYIDGRIYYNILIDEATKKTGISELRYIEPQKIRKIKSLKKSKSPTGVEINVDADEYFLFNDKGLTAGTTQGVKLSVDSVAYCNSGKIDQNTGMVMSYLHKAIKPTNQLKMIEDALVIYRVSRAPERRIFYIDVGNLPKVKAEQYVQDIMNKFRNKLVYDANTGEIKDDKKHLSMMEDFWMPRREGGKGTEITTLDGAQNLGQIEDINYFQNKLFQSLNVPLSRLRPDTGFSIGQSSTITRDEVKFSKFIGRLRNKFSGLFSDILRIQLIAKGIIREDEWEEMLECIKYTFQKDNHYAELKNAEITQNRIATLNSIDMFVGKYYSINWVRKNVLMQTDEEIKEIDTQIKAEPAPVDPNQQ
jgi:formylmethanofuran dehydrogenase subunit D